MAITNLECQCHRRRLERVVFSTLIKYQCSGENIYANCGFQLAVMSGGGDRVPRSWNRTLPKWRKR